MVVIRDPFSILGLGYESILQAAHKGATSNNTGPTGPTGVLPLDRLAQQYADQIEEESRRIGVNVPPDNRGYKDPLAFFTVKAHHANNTLKRTANNLVLHASYVYYIEYFLRYFERRQFLFVCAEDLWSKDSATRGDAWARLQRFIGLAPEAAVVPGKGTTKGVRDVPPMPSAVAQLDKK